MNKKTIGIIAATIVAIILIVVAVFALKGKEQVEVDNTTNRPTQEEIDNAEDLQQYMPDKTIDEIIDIDREELTDEQEEKFDDTLNDYTIYEVDEIISTPDDQDLENETPEIVYKDTDGNIHRVDITEEEWNMTDEEAAEERRRMEAEMDQRMKEYAERWEKKQNGEEVGPITPPTGDYEDDIQYDPSGENEAYDPYRGYGSYEAYIDHICKELPNVSREEIIRRNPDPATGEAGPATDDDIRDNPLSGN